MSDLPSRHLPLRRTSTIVMCLAVLIGLVLIGAGLFMLIAEQPDTIGVVAIALGAALGVGATLLHVICLLILKAESNLNRIHGETLDLQDRVRRFEPMIKSLSENSQISEAARSITNRAHEREAVRQAIREEMYSGDWEAATYLIELMEERFGYKQEAQAIRAEMNQIREMTIEEKITQAISHIEKLLTAYQWDRAGQEIHRLMKLFPRHERVLALPNHLAALRAKHKQELLAEWNKAVERNEIDHGIAILTELDKYMSPKEAEALRESARHVFKEHLLNMGVQFGLAAAENRWRDALEIALQIRKEFPNSRMAKEVGDKLEVLRVRAGVVKDVEVTQRRT